MVPLEPVMMASQKEKPRQGIATGGIPSMVTYPVSSQKEKPRQGIATADVPLAFVQHSMSQKEKPRQGIATTFPVSLSSRATISCRKKKSPVRGLQHNVFAILVDMLHLSVAKRKAPSGDCNSTSRTSQVRRPLKRSQKERLTKLCGAAQSAPRAKPIAPYHKSPFGGKRCFYTRPFYA